MAVTLALVEIANWVVTTREVGHSKYGGNIALKGSLPKEATPA